MKILLIVLLLAIWIISRKIMGNLAMGSEYYLWPIVLKAKIEKPLLMF